MNYLINVTIKRVTKIILALIVIGAFFSIYLKNDTEQLSLQIYSAAGVRAPVKEIAARFEEKHNDIEIELIYGSSGELLSRINYSGEGDLFIPGDPYFVDKLDYLDKEIIAKHSPALVVNDSIEDSLEKVSDIKNKEVDFLLVEPEMAAIGSHTDYIIERLYLKEQVKDNLYGEVSTASQVPMYMSLGYGDVGITWYSNYLQYEDDLSMVELSPSIISQVDIVGAILPGGKAEKAREFLDFMLTDEAENIFRIHGFNPGEKGV